MPDTINRLHTPLLDDVHTNHPALLEHPTPPAGTDYLPVTIGTFDTVMGQRVHISIHRAPQLVPGWLAYLGLRDSDLTNQQLIEGTWTRSAYATWRGIRVLLTSFQNGTAPIDRSKENHG